MSIIAKVAAVPALENIQFSYQSSETSTLQLINGISNDLQKLLKYLIGTTVFTPFQFVTKLDLYLNDDELFGIC